jgi:GT2 family glycosyltransferase
VFVIHAQTPDEVQQLRIGVPSAVVIEPGKNLGSAAGWNLGIRWLLSHGVDYIGIWNVDVRPDPFCIRHLVEAMLGDPTIGACQPLLLYSHDPGRVQMFGGSVDLRSGVGHHDYNRATGLATLPALRDAGYLDGGTMLVRPQVLRKVGLFDERFFMYAEDSDLCQRIRRAGYRTVAVRDARAWHCHRADLGPLPGPYQVFYETRNRFYFVRKHAGSSAWLRLVAHSLATFPRYLLYYTRHLRQPLLAWAYTAGTLAGIAGRMGKRGWVG